MWKYDDLQKWTRLKEKNVFFYMYLFFKKYYLEIYYFNHRMQ